MGAAPCYIQALPVTILAVVMCDALGQTQSIGTQDARLVHMQDRASPRPWCAMSNQPKPRRYDHVGAWFLTPQASKWGLAFTIIFGLLTAAVAVAK